MSDHHAAVPTELAASARHLELISESIDKIEHRLTRLKAARAQTLDQIAVASKRVTHEWSTTELLSLYEKLNCPGLFTAWNAAGLPHPARMRADAEAIRRSAPNDPASNGWIGEWAWDGPGRPIPGPHPMDNTPVVYVLYGADAEPVYCGSTEHFLTRLKNHDRDGKRFVAWRAVPCAGREQAFVLEDRLLKQSCPPLNVRVGR